MLTIDNNDFGDNSPCGDDNLRRKAVIRIACSNIGTPASPEVTACYKRRLGQFFVFALLYLWVLNKAIFFLLLYNCTFYRYEIISSEFVWNYMMISVITLMA